MCVRHTRILSLCSYLSLSLTAVWFFFTFKRTFSLHRSAWAVATALKHTFTHINISQVFQCDSKEFLLFSSRRFSLYAREANLLQIFRIANSLGCAVSKCYVTTQNEDISVNSEPRQRKRERNRGFERQRKRHWRKKGILNMKDVMKNTAKHVKWTCLVFHIFCSSSTVPILCCNVGLFVSHCITIQSFQNCWHIVCCRHFCCFCYCRCHRCRRYFRDWSSATIPRNRETLVFVQGNEGGINTWILRITYIHTEHTLIRKREREKKPSGEPTLNKSDLHVLMQVDFFHFNVKMGLTNLQQMQEKCESIYITLTRELSGRDSEWQTHQMEWHCAGEDRSLSCRSTTTWLQLSRINPKLLLWIKF